MGKRFKRSMINIIKKYENELGIDYVGIIINHFYHVGLDSDACLEYIETAIDNHEKMVDKQNNDPYKVIKSWVTCPKVLAALKCVRDDMTALKKL